MSNDEITRFQKMEKLLESKISRRFKIRRLEKHDFGYLIEHIYGKTGVAYEDYAYDFPVKKLKKETLVKRYDLIRPTRCQITENDIVNIGLHFILKNVRPYAASCSEA